jgi:hypothetical protein
MKNRVHTTYREMSPNHRAQPKSAATKRRIRRSLIVTGVLSAASLAVPSALAAPATAQTTRHATTTSCVSGVKGIPPRGSAYVGAAASGTQSMDSLQAQLSTPLREHRAYFEANQIKSAVSVTKADLAAGRIPWISFKVPYSWADMANGMGDAWAADISRQLAAVGGPIWIAFYHEPEGNGPIQDWVRMQKRLGPIVHANSNNIAYTVIYSAWNITYGGYPLSSVFPTGAGVNILGVDIYNQYNVRGTKMMDPMRFIPVFQSWADGHGIRWAIAETGYTAEQSNIDGYWLDTMYNDAVANGAAVVSYFDSSLNSVADWTLDTSLKIDSYQRILSTSAALC